MATPSTMPTTVPDAAPRLPPLEPGDQLTRAEFERRYQAMPNLKKAELIEGEVFMPSPVRWDHHGTPHADLLTWLGTYKVHTPGTSSAGNASIRLDLDNEPQPDSALIILPEHGGRVHFEEGYVVGSPEWLGEVSASTVSIDLNRKFRVYRRNEVLEYLVWRVLDQAIDWFSLRQGQYVLLPPNKDGFVCSEVFPGLWLDPQALIRGDLARVLEVLRLGLASPEHAAFVDKLKRAKTNGSP